MKQGKRAKCNSEPGIVLIKLGVSVKVAKSTVLPNIVICIYMLEFQPESCRKKNAPFPSFIYFWSADSRNAVLGDLIIELDFQG